MKRLLLLFATIVLSANICQVSADVISPEEEEEYLQNMHKPSEATWEEEDKPIVVIDNEEETEEAEVAGEAINEENEECQYHSLRTTTVNESKPYSALYSKGLMTTAIIFIVLTAVWVIMRFCLHKKNVNWDPFTISGLLTALMTIASMIGIYASIQQVFTDIKAAGDVSPTMVAAYAKAVIIPIVVCFIFSLLSLILGIISRVGFKNSRLHGYSIYVIIIGVVGILGCIVSYFLPNFL